MKRRHIYLLIVIILVQMTSFEIYSQSGNAKSLEIGNKWVYKEWSSYYGDSYDYSYSIEEIIKDTIINNKFYAVIKHKSPTSYYSFFERADSMKIYFYSTYDDSEYVKVNFSQRGTILENGYYLYADTINFWGRDRREIRQETGPGHIGYGNSYYIEGIGLENSGYMSHGGSSRGQYLVAAYLNGVKYGDTVLVDVKKEQQIPTHFELLQNYPNPFNPRTTIKFLISETTNVVLTIYSMLGEKIVELVNKNLNEGIYQVEFDGSNISSGIYFCQLRTKDFIKTKKMVLLK